MRQIVLDTETTGLDPAQGHRVIEVGCVELVDRKLTGRHLHLYMNPERDVEAAALCGALLCEADTSGSATILEVHAQHRSLRTEFN